MFRKLCGESTLKNVVIVTNMWGKVEQSVGESRERELAGIYFKPALDKDAQLARHHNTVESSHDIIRSIMKNDPAPLRIQQELVDEGKDIKETAAGEAVNEELNALMRRHAAEMNALREEMRQALKEKDEETKRELEEETRRIREQMNRMKAESEAMASKYEEERRKMEEKMQRMQEEARQERSRAHAEHMKEVNGLKAELTKNTTASAADRRATQQRIQELENQWNNRPRPPPKKGPCVVI